MRVVWLIDSLGPGGAEALVPRYARVAIRSGIDLRVVIVGSREMPHGRPLRDLGVEVTLLEARNLRDLRAWRRLLVHLRDLRPNVVHAHLDHAVIGAALATAWLGLPFVATLHEMPDTGDTLRERLKKRLATWLLRRRADAIIAVSDAQADAWKKTGRIPADRLEVVPNAVTVRAPRSPAERTRARRELEITDDVPTLACVCVLRRSKGVESLLEAVADTNRRGCDVHLLIAGDGPLRKLLQERAVALGIRGKCRFLGHLDSVEPLLAGADLFVHPSRQEALPTVVLEALEAGLPVVATDVGGTREIVGDEGAFLIPPDSVPALVRAIGEALSNPEVAAAKAAIGRQRVERSFGDRDWSDRLHELYRRLAGPYPATAGPRVAVVEPVGRGGLIQYAFQLCRALHDAGVTVELVTADGWELRELSRGFRVTTLFAADDPTVTRPDARGPRRFARRMKRAIGHYRRWSRLIRYCRARDFDIVQLGDLRFPTDAIPVALLRLFGQRLTDVCHNVEPFATGGRRGGAFGMGRWSRLLLEVAYRRFATVFVHHDVNRERFLARYRVDPERVVSIVHGNEAIFRELDEGLPTEQLAQRLDLMPGAPVVATFGSMSGYKGLDLLLQAFVGVRERVPDAHLLIAGHPLPDFDLDGHRRIADRLGVADAVRWVPRYLEPGELGGWLRLASLVALPYREGYQSGVAHLALTFGKPVIATRTGAFSEIVERTGSGLLVPPGEPRPLAAAITKVLEDVELRDRLGAAALRAAESTFAWSRPAEAIATRYRWLTGEPSAGLASNEGAP